MLPFDTVAASAGGVGLFLVGMLTMTSALRALAGNRMHRILSRWTTTTLTGVGTGTLSTALLQSSSATTIAAVGFVGAGLLTFEQSLGIIFGANLGTTVTGWLVALFGFKLDIGAVASPLILLGVVVRMVGTKDVAAAGQAVAGFGLIFAGIEALQAALGGIGTSLLPTEFDDDSLQGRATLFALGVAITLLTQSSSAGVAAALTAVHAGALPLTSAAAMVIGMDVGTTFSAFLATLGGSVMARRTGYAHVVYNLMTACVALLLLTPFLTTWQALNEGDVLASSEFTLVAFHTCFNVLGVVLIVPLVRPFTRFLQVLVPARSQAAGSRMDRDIASEPALAWPGLISALERLSNDVVSALARAVKRMEPLDSATADTFQSENLILRHRVLSMPAVEWPHDAARAVSGEAAECALHALDHLYRLVRRARNDASPEALLSAELIAAQEQFAAIVGAVDADVEGLIGEASQRRLKDLWRGLDRDKHRVRGDIMRASAEGELSPQGAADRLDNMRSVRRNTYHLWRAGLHLRNLANISWPWGAGAQPHARGGEKLS